MNDVSVAAHYAIVNAADPSPRPWARFHTRREAESYLRGCRQLVNGDFEHAGFRYRIVLIEDLMKTEIGGDRATARQARTPYRVSLSTPSVTGAEAADQEGTG